MSDGPAPAFAGLGLPKALLKVLDELGYETPTPIQEQIIPHVLEGRDVLGQARTGTGKTAAFALPLLAGLDLKRRGVQALVLTPTRELAIQVAEAFARYAAGLKAFQVLPVYGGQAYEGQIRHLRRGVHVVVGTPGRVMDHMRRGTLALDGLRSLVLDEADEMLRMGFIDDVRWILEQTPPARQVALFSATLPAAVRRIAAHHLSEPQQITIKDPPAAEASINQRYWMVAGHHKLDALTRILEAEPFDAVLVFVRTRTATIELADKLGARGYACAALNGEIPQKRREQTVEQLKKGKLDVLVATDVAARGLDIDRVSHVVNYDIPYDTEAYVHRIGRTGRAGRAGEAVLFVAPRERRMLHAIEKATRQKIPLMELPSTEAINDRRIARFKQSITDVLATEELGVFHMLLEQYRQEHNVPALDIAAALARMVQGDEPLLLAAERDRGPAPRPQAREDARRSRGDRGDKDNRTDKPKKGDKGKTDGREAKGQASAERPGRLPKEGMERFRVEAGREHGLQPGDLVGALVNEVMLDAEFIGRIDIQEDHSFVDLPEGMPRGLLRLLKRVKVVGRPMRVSRLKSKRESAAMDAPAGAVKGGGKKGGTNKSKNKGKGKNKGARRRDP